MTKRLVDIDDAVLAEARASLDTATIKDTVHAALRAVATARAGEVDESIRALASMSFDERAEAWRQ